MLNYFVMAYPNRVDQHMAPGNANPIYSSIVPDYANNNYGSSGYFIWTKSPNGYPWDVKTFDYNYIYDRSTELNWNDPTSFKRFNRDLAMSQRCLRTDQAGAGSGKPAADTGDRAGWQLERQAPRCRTDARRCGATLRHGDRSTRARAPAHVDALVRQLACGVF